MLVHKVKSLAMEMHPIAHTCAANHLNDLDLSYAQDLADQKKEWQKNHCACSSEVWEHCVFKAEKKIRRRNKRTRNHLRKLLVEPMPLCLKSSKIDFVFLDWRKKNR